jgi:DNA-directed RNA polymerase subunit RPC12/RpoP
LEIVTINCASCGAPIKVPPELDNFNCAFCGANLMVKRGDGYVALKLMEQVTKSIQDSGAQTQSTIRESTQVTQSELKRLQLGQEISSLQIQLASIQAEIRSLQRQKADRKIKGQLKGLSQAETSLWNRINKLQLALADSFPNKETAQAHLNAGLQQLPPKPRGGLSSLGRGCLTWFLVLIVFTCLIGIPAQALDKSLFNEVRTSGSEGTSGPIFTAASLLIFLISIIGFVYGLTPNAEIWISAKKWIRSKFHRNKKTSPPSDEAAISIDQPKNK